MRDKINQLLQSLIDEGERALGKVVVSGRRMGNKPFIEREHWNNWGERCRILLHVLGEAVTPWRESVNNDWSTLENVKKRLAALLAIQEALNVGLLMPIEDHIWAEAFDNLLDQADYLSRDGFHIAAGVLV